VISEQYKKELTEAKLSPMPQFNHLITVEQMIDMVTFLQAHYKLVEPTYQYP
jgi:hypothetical protein